MSDPLDDLSRRGVSVWLDDLSRQRLATGSLADLIAHDHVVGVTTNPTIFAKAIATTRSSSAATSSGASSSRSGWPTAACWPA